MSFTVADLLQRPNFKNAQVIAGKKGIQNQIKWAHVIEITSFGHLLNGQEVILTTGVSWADNTNKAIKFLQELLDHNISALCVELASHIKEIPKEMLTLAEEKNFPIILFSEEVKFIDITRDLHEILLGYHENIWWELENLHDTFSRTLTTNGSIGDFLKTLHQTSKKQIAFKHGDKFRFFPTPSTKMQQQWIDEINHSPEKYFSQPVYFLDEEVATVYCIADLNKVTFSDKISLKRCGEFLEQYFWKHHHQQEVNQMLKNKWLLDAISDSCDNHKIKMMIEQNNPNIKIGTCIIAIMPIDNSLLDNDNMNKPEINTLLLLRNALKTNDLHLITYKHAKQNQHILLIIDQKRDKYFFDRLDDSLNIVKDNNHDNTLADNLHLLSFGKSVLQLDHLTDSYTTALTTLNYQKNITVLERPFYKNLAIYRLLDQFKDKKELNNIIDDYIGGIIAYDKTNNTELLKTLNAYYQNASMKNQTAKELHIVRQTLYHRLDRIEQLLKEHSINPTDQFMIQFAIQAYMTLNQNNQ